MCGILCYVKRKHDRLDSLPCWESLTTVNDARGPDGHSEALVLGEELQIVIRGSVLSLKGQQIIQQPIISGDGRLHMLWNGEVFDSLTPLDPCTNDGVQLMTRLMESIQGVKNEAAVERCISAVLSSIEGPYAAVISDKVSSTLYYGRDTLGRRSLLQSYSTDGGLLLCSSASIQAMVEGHLFAEVECGSLWKVDLKTEKIFPTRLPRMETPYTLPHILAEISAPQRDERNACNMKEAVEGFTDVLSDSVKRRVQRIRAHAPYQEAQIAVLFSGGLDCTTLAMLAHQHIDQEQPIDLLNVAFENPRVLQAKVRLGEEDCASGYEVPDRKTGRQSYQELQRLTPERKWNFVEVNISHEEYMKGRPLVESLMEPCTSVMDLSIASALYFACRGKGSDGYISKARVLLSGLGADELLGGYSRHRKAFMKGGRQALVEELQMDLDRLATRNLGRDDRILSSSGKECRYPFLSHAVISFIAKLPIEVKMDFVSLPAGQGDKMLLRQVAAQLGLKDASLLVKRAIQFGARSAKMEVGQGKILGHERLKS